MARTAPPKVPETASQNGEVQPGAEPWFALPLSDLQAIQTHLQREAIAGQEAQALLNKLAQAVPATMQD
jgi:hypothetical protein